MFIISVEDPRGADVMALLDEHLSDMRATSPVESVHALDVQALVRPELTFWTARREDGTLLGCGAMQQHGSKLGELKSMRTAQAARGRGIASAVLQEVIAESRRRGLSSLKLETGTAQYFASARRLYERHGFTPCEAFAPYKPDPHSAFYELRLS